VGDRVVFHGNPAEVMLASSNPYDSNPVAAWHVTRYGSGVLISDPTLPGPPGHTFIPKEHLSENGVLEFESRATSTPKC
jgi:hypothetical protein